MIEETITRLEARLQSSPALNEQNRKELLGLLATLKTEVSALSQTHAEEAQKIVSFTQASTTEATREEVRPERLSSHLEELSSSVGGFEQSHPRLVQIVNRLAETLSNLGI